MLHLSAGTGRDQIAAVGHIETPVRFDSRYLTTVAQSFADEMEVHQASPTRPALCIGKESHRCLIMPQRIG